MRVPWVSLLASATAYAAQIPLDIWSEQHPAHGRDILTGEVDLVKWNLSEAPSVDGTGHLIFDTASAFLQHWPNTRLRNGHNIVVGSIAEGTLLYHGTSVNEVPKVPEWTATDPEHSYIFCRNSVADQGCWHLTLVANRPLNVLYFDGSSAAKMPDGPMDSQDITTWGKIGSNRTFGERERIRFLCDWGKPFNVDGFVRMEMDFEIMLCDFTAGVDVLSFSNLAGNSRRRGPGRDPGRPSEPEPLPRNASTPSDSPIGIQAAAEVIWSGHWHNRYPGEKRIQLDYARILSFYDTALFPSLVSARSCKERWFHRLLDISDVDMAKVRPELERLLSSREEPSGVDWEVLLRVVVDRYAGRLELLQHILNQTEPGKELDAAKKAQTQMRAMLTPYILHSARPNATSVSSTHDWAASAFKLCATSHTSYIVDRALEKLTYSEVLLLGAVQGTSREICRVVTTMWAEGVEAGLDDGLRPSASDSNGEHVPRLVRKWLTDVEALMGWLDWSVWVKCGPACSIEEECYLPTWPFRDGGLKNTPGSPHDPAPNDEIARPQPRCIPRF